MTDHRRGSKNNTSWPSKRRHPMAHIHVVKIDRMEAADPLEHVRAHRHVSADKTRKGSGRGRHSLVGTTEDPIKLPRKPRGPFGLVVRVRGAAYRQNGRVAIRPQEFLNPSRLGCRIVVEKREDLSCCMFGSNISSLSRTKTSFGSVCVSMNGQSRFLVAELAGDDMDRYARVCPRGGPRRLADSEEFFIIIDRDDHLYRMRGLVTSGSNRLLQELPPFHSESRNNHTDAQTNGLHQHILRPGGCHGGISRDFAQRRS